MWKMFLLEDIEEQIMFLYGNLLNFNAVLLKFIP